MHITIRSLLMISLLAVLTVTEPSFAYAAEPLNLDDVAPDWTLYRPGGKSLNFYDHAQDRVSVVLFWATWCPYCRALMPKLEELAQQYKGRPVRFYALNIWEDSDPVAHMAKKGYSFDLLLEAELVADAYGVRGTPGLLVVDQDHRVLYTRIKGSSESDAKRNVALAVESALPPRQ